MTGRHRVLVVEDDRPTADDLADILRSLDCEPVVVDNKRAALARLSREPLCLAIFDLQIKLESDSIRGHIEAGRSLVREARKLYPEHAGPCYRFPILVVSGYAREVGSAVEVMKDGADDVIQKPLDSREVSHGVRQALERSGRATHEACAALTARPAMPAGAIVLAIPGDRERRRTRVTIGPTSLGLTDASLLVLLHLVVGKLAGERVHKTELGARNDQGFRGISVLRDALKPALGDADIIKNDHQGYYWLTEDVTIGDCDPDRLVEIGDARITALAERLRQHRAQQPAPAPEPEPAPEPQAPKRKRSRASGD
jgi:DNA-binding response OmpR family regulator